MEQLKYITENQVDPTGKPAVYFTAHPDDHASYLHDVSARLIGVADCAVYYHEPGHTETDDRDLTLEQMRLFVIPVTRRLLESDNLAVRRDLTYAAEHKKPILPLLYETGLTSRFNALFGEIQYLDPNQDDATAIRFEEKLRHYLDSVLLDDDTRKQIRDAFDACLFMSYRKKDRKYARQLMHLIHAHPEFRDVAIWYDEFLTPGESFNDIIRAELLQSDLFTLVVTPHLLEPDNYVMTTEYTTAVDAKKRILPVVMEKTDDLRLAECYHNLPLPIDGYDGQALSAWMNLHLKSVSLRRRTDARHDYLIGLAYLNGIHVEVNTDMALTLIEGAAKRGLLQAMQKLAAMYHNGEGVGRDERREVYWLERAVDAAERAFSASPRDDTLLQLLECLEQTRFAWYMMKDIKRALEICRKQVALTDAWYERDPSPEIGYYTIRSRMGTGDIYLEMGQSDKAGRYYAEAIMRMNASEDTLCRMPMREVPMLYERMAHVEMQANRLNQAEQFFLRALRQRETAHRYRITSDSQRDLAISYNELGLISLKLGKKDEARAYYLQALEIQTGIARAAKTDVAKRELCVTLLNLSIATMSMLDFQSAESYLSTARQMTEENLAHSGSVQDSVLLGRILSELANLFDYQRKHEKSESAALRAYEILYGLAERNPTLDIREQLAQCLLLRAKLASNRKDGALAIRCHEEARDVINALYKETGAKSTVVLSYNTRMSLARLKMKEEAYGEAKQICLEALRFHEEETAREPDLVHLIHLNECYILLFEICRDTGELAEAKKYARLAMALTEKETGETSRFLLALQYRDYAALCEKLDDVEEAIRYYVDADAICAKLTFDEARLASLQCTDALIGLMIRQRNIGQAKSYALLSQKRCEVFLKEHQGHNAVTKMLADALFTLARISHALHENAQAKQYYPAASQHYGKCIVQENYVENLLQIDACMSSCGELCEEDDEPAVARDCYTEAISALVALFNMIPEDETLDDGEKERLTDSVLHCLSNRQHQAGRICMTLSDIKAAETHFRGALAIDEQFAKQMPTEQNLQNLTANYTKLGDIRLDMEDEEGAEVFYKEALRIDRAVAAHRPSPQNKGALASSCYRMGALKEDLNLLKEGLDLCEELVRHDPMNPSFRALRDAILSAISEI
ncbi:MAG: tetratricopeptide repeat protein [Clostridia bacterium]|nr:tetratricopeptide repeat protein [Clostridia bacterium]